MNLEDDSFLSSYLDDELDPADRLAVEWSVESSPALGEQIRSLALARDAVAGLGRPAIPLDLAPAIRSRLASRRRLARLRSLARPARAVVSVSTIAAVAASLLFALILLHHPLHESNQAAKVAKVETLPTSPVTRPNSPVIRAPRPEVANRKPVRPPAVRPSLEATPAGEKEELASRRAVAGMLDGPRVRRITIVTDVVDAPDRIMELVRGEPRKVPEFGRISICQDLVIDPERAEAAEVFAVPMDGSGLRSFVERLQAHFPDAVEEGEADPGLVTQLSEVGRVAVFRGTAAAPLGEPPANLDSYVAHRTDAPDPFVSDPVSGRRKPRDRRRPPPPETSNGGSRYDLKDDNFVGPPDPNPPPGPGEIVTVLVWVTRPARL